jgi:uncharacterized protein YbaR (Trm112 family)
MAELIEVECPVCRGTLWVDVEKKVVVQHEKTKKKKITSLDDLLLKEQRVQGQVNYIQNEFLRAASS